MKFILPVVFLVFMGCASQTQETHNVLLNKKAEKYAQDILRGSNTEFRNWWNVLHYDLVLTPDFENQFISGTVTITLEVTDDAQDKIMQIDLQNPMNITKIVALNHTSTEKNEPKETEIQHWTRKGNAYFVDLNALNFNKKDQKIVKFYFEGNPRIAKHAPWDGGWIFIKDEKGRPWMSAAVQGLGASAWFPNKDFQGDEPDNGVTFTMIVPEDLVAIANGRLWKTSFIKGEAGTNVYTWEVKNPINNYCIIPYIGHYTNFSDEFMGENGSLSLQYWVLDYNLEKAQKHFQQVKPMMLAFEDWMGAYPFYEDDYKLVEAPYLGMEHQSAVAYGNQYMNGYLGSDRTYSGYGNQFDFIIVHETGHEWFGNSITTQDIADMWVHEGFTTYTEVMYVENQFGKDAANAYVQGLRPMIENKRNIIGDSYGTNTGGSRDMYYKGANMIHTLRQLMEDDVKFKQMIRDMNTTFYHQVITGQQIEGFISDYTGIDLTEFFNQYLRTTKAPTLETKTENGKTYFRWTNIIEGFDMPVKLKNSDKWIFPNAKWKMFEGNTPLVVDDNFYVFQE